MRDADTQTLPVANESKSHDGLMLKRSIELVKRRARTVASAADVPSPCHSVCSINANTGLCDGCFRTCDEITVWGTADDVLKRQVWTLIEQRMVELQPPNDLLA